MNHPSLLKILTDVSNFFSKTVIVKQRQIDWEISNEVISFYFYRLSDDNSVIRGTRLIIDWTSRDKSAPRLMLRKCKILQSVKNSLLNKFSISQFQKPKGGPLSSKGRFLLFFFQQKYKKQNFFPVLSQDTSGIKARTFCRMKQCREKN